MFGRATGRNATPAGPSRLLSAELVAMVADPAAQGAVGGDLVEAHLTERRGVGVQRGCRLRAGLADVVDVVAPNENDAPAGYTAVGGGGPPTASRRSRNAPPTT